MFTVGLDGMKSLILYSQLNKNKVEEGKKVRKGKYTLEEPKENRVMEIIFGSLLKE